MKKFLSHTLNELFNENIQDDQVKWESFKHNIGKYTINFSKKLSKNTNKKIADLETKCWYVDNIDYTVCKQELDAIYKQKAKVIKIRSTCNWYELGEKFTKFFLNLGKHCATQS